MSCGANPMSWGSCIGGAIGGALGSAGKAVAGGVFDSIAHAFGDAASAAVNWLWRQVSAATAIDLTGAGMHNLFAITAVIAAVIALAMFCIQVIACALRQDFAGLGRAVRGMLVAFVGAAFAIATTQLLLVAVDDLCTGVVQAATGENMTGVGQKLVIAQALSGLNSAGLFLMSIVLLISVVVIWCALMIRKMLVIVAAVFAPIAFSGATSDLTRGWVRKWIELTVALVCSKLILVLIFLIGLAMVNGAGATGGATNQITNLAIGALTLLLAGFAPWLAIKMVHFAGDAFHHVHAQALAARAGAGAVIAAPQKANTLHTQGASVQEKFTKASRTPADHTGRVLKPNPGGRRRPSSGPGQSGGSPNGPTAGLTPTGSPGGGGPATATGGLAAAAALQAVKLPGRAAGTLGQSIEHATPPDPSEPAAVRRPAKSTPRPNRTEPNGRHGGSR